MAQYTKAMYRGHKITIEDTTSEMRERGAFMCINCQQELTPVLGKDREPHFRHLVENHDCNYESYIHKLAKAALRDLFYDSEKFIVSYQAEFDCKYKDKCKFHEDRCKRQDFNEINLKDYYDTCEMEKSSFITTINRKLRLVPDLKLTSKAHPENGELFLEVLVTSPCSEDKIKSGKRIVEIAFPEDDKELANTLNKFRIEGGCRFQAGEDVTLFNFKDEIPEEPESQKMELSQFILHNSYKAHLGKIPCSHLYDGKYDRKCHPRYELYVPFGAIPEDRLYVTGLCRAKATWPKLQNCLICRHYYHCPSNPKAENIDDELVATVDTSSDDNALTAKNCKKFEYNESFAAKANDNLGVIPSWEYVKQY